MDVKLGKNQPEKNDFINIEEIDGVVIGVIHKNKLIEVLNRCNKE